MKGYFNNTEATKDVIDADGFLHTGDVGYYSNDNNIFCVDRMKELIKVKGFQVSYYAYWYYVFSMTLWSFKCFYSVRSET